MSTSIRWALFSMKFPSVQNMAFNSISFHSRLLDFIFFVFYVSVLFSMVTCNKRNPIFSFIVKLPFEEAANSTETREKILSILTNGRTLDDGILLLAVFFLLQHCCGSAAISSMFCHSIWKFSNVWCSMSDLSTFDSLFCFSHCCSYV